ncbi:hypothetical protein, partial [Bosea sp. (in: a-proteobacteria)]|uniref:hypothetical protein n=1 Tax=Bosea sp. (in: a-proteobacteria) TaxID=1871050 RepID=UPI0031FF0C3D
TPERATWRLAMNARPDNDFEALDYKTSRSICDAVGERLQQHIRPEHGLSDRLQQLLDQLRRRDSIGGP